MTFVSATPLDVFADSGMDRDLAPRCCLSVSGGDAAEMAEADAVFSTYTRPAALEKLKTA